MHSVQPIQAVSSITATGRSRCSKMVATAAETITATAETIAATAREMPDAWEGLVYFLDVISLRMADNRGFGDLLMDGRFTSDTFARARAGIARHTAVLVNRAKEQGTLRSDFEVNDIPLLMQVVKMAQKFGGDEAPQAYRRALGFMIDGLCASRTDHRELPVPALSSEQLDHVLHRFQD